MVVAADQWTQSRTFSVTVYQDLVGKHVAMMYVMHISVTMVEHVNTQRPAPTLSVSARWVIMVMIVVMLVATRTDVGMAEIAQSCHLVPFSTVTVRLGFMVIFARLTAANQIRVIIVERVHTQTHSRFISAHA